MPGTVAVGSYTVTVDVSTALTPTTPQGSAGTAAYVVNNAPATGVTIAANPSTATLMLGHSVTYTAAGQGGSGTYQYEFLMTADNGATWTIVRPYGPTNTWTWTPSAEGAYIIAVYVRTNAGGPNPYDQYALAWLTVTPAITPATSVQISGSPPSPVTFGTTVTLQAVGVGSTTGVLPTPASGYDYEFLVTYDNGATWIVIQPWGNGPSMSWKPTATGTFIIGVYTRTTQTPVYDAYALAWYTVQ
jgi:hypothetical protein